jgi:hypothetical protein
LLVAVVADLTGVVVAVLVVIVVQLQANHRAVAHLLKESYHLTQPLHTQ